MAFPSAYYKAERRLKMLQCETCHGGGELDDMEPGDTSFHKWQCPDCKGTGFAGGVVVIITTRD